MKLRLFLVLIILFSSSQLLAKIKFDGLTQDQINLSELSIKPKPFYTMVHRSVQTLPNGLGTYGRLGINLCDYQIKGKALSELRNEQGQEIRYLSNPSCEQLVLFKLLKTYGYDSSMISDYRHRRCLIDTSKIFSPILEFYAIKYLERKKGSCEFCDRWEKERVMKIKIAQKKMKKQCKTQFDSTLNLVKDFDQAVEEAYIKKTTRP